MLLQYLYVKQSFEVVWKRDRDSSALDPVSVNLCLRTTTKHHDKAICHLMKKVSCNWNICSKNNRATVTLQKKFVKLVWSSTLLAGYSPTVMMNVSRVCSNTRDEISQLNHDETAELFVLYETQEFFRCKDKPDQVRFQCVLVSKTGRPPVSCRPSRFQSR